MDRKMRVLLGGPGWQVRTSAIPGEVKRVLYRAESLGKDGLLLQERGPQDRARSSDQLGEFEAGGIAQQSRQLPVPLEDTV